MKIIYSWVNHGGHHSLMRPFWAKRRAAIRARWCLQDCLLAQKPVLDIYCSPPTTLKVIVGSTLGWWFQAFLADEFDYIVLHCIDFNVQKFCISVRNHDK